VFTVDGVTQLAARTFNVKIDLTLAASTVATTSTLGGGTKNLAPAALVTEWGFGPGNGQVVLLANWLNGNTSQFNSRIYLYNQGSIQGDVTARALKMPPAPAGGTGLIQSTELTPQGSPVSLGTLAGYSGMKIDLADILNQPQVKANLPGGALPYQENGGNLIVEITVRGVDDVISGTSQVFSGTTAFGQVPLVKVPTN